MRIPSVLVRQLYSRGSLANDPEGFHFALRNRLYDVALTRVKRVSIDGTEVPLPRLSLELSDGRRVAAADVSPETPAQIRPLETARVHASNGPLSGGTHQIELLLDTRPFGELELRTEDGVADQSQAATASGRVPHTDDERQNYSASEIAERRRFVEGLTGTALEHISRFSFDPALVRGNTENFTGVAQVPIGFAGPLRVNGEYAQGEFIIPLATTEGTLVASYNRGMKVLTEAGGVMTTISADAMQRAPVFAFPSAREARAFVDWLDQHLEEVRREAESTSHVAKLLQIERYLSNKFAFLRFDFSTGDAAGQNMVTRATFAASLWIAQHAPAVERWFLESNVATDKKASRINMLHPRGKRVTAEAVIPRDLLKRELRAEPEALHRHGDIANIGALLSGANNNGLHSANAITAMFIATGQDVANVTESAAALGYVEITAERDLYMSITLPSLIVATHGGGTGLPTQREALEVLGCYGVGKARKLAEIVAAVVLAGELSLASAISSREWVEAHERYGRHR